MPLFRINGVCLIACAALFAGYAPSVHAAEPSGAAAPKQEEAEKTGLYFDEDGLSYRSPSGLIELNLGGRLHLDYGDGDVNPEAAFDDDAFMDDVFLRRGRLEFQGTIADDFTGIYQYDFREDDSTPIKDAGIAYSGLENVIFTVGNMKEPFSFEELVSSNNTTFMERSLANTFAPSRFTGAAVGAVIDTWTVTAGVFGGNLNDTVEDGGASIAGRLTYAPIYDRENRHFLHFGVAGNYRSLDDGQSLSFDAGPESAAFDGSLVDTGDIPGADDVFRVGLEAAYIRGPYRVQAEYILAITDVGSGSNVTLHAGYVEAAYVFGGKNRNYSLSPSSKYGAAFGIFGAVEPEDSERVSAGGVGVFEAAARFSAIDLNDGTVTGGTERNVTLGLNWYPEKNLRLMLNYVHAEADESPDVGDVDADIVQARFQVYF